MKNSSKQDPIYLLRLFIAGASPNSIKAVSNIKTICEKYLKNKYKLEIIDVHQQPTIARDEQVIAVPLLIKAAPAPFKRLIGNMSDTAQVLKGLQLDYNSNEI